ncbi:MAG TPA: Crp/Fnr family transcriptional regulator [Draconibacterium sp.]|nr:Crp/Fnr family transcriptional regulator [Draconibacterium sp.]
MSLKNILPNLNPQLLEKIATNANVVDIPKNTEVMREGQYVKAVPIVTNGLVKVFTRNEDKELLLYYIKPSESCIMSFDACLNNSPSKVYASTEEDSTILLLPVDKVFSWMKEYPEMNSLFYQQYNTRYNELIHMINQLLFEKMDKRLLKYLQTEVSIRNINPIKISHQKIANHLGTAREVVSRILKKLEVEGEISQNSDGIKVL